MEKETIICSAVKVGRKIWRGHRHCHALQAMNDELSYELNRKELAKINEEQGFMTTENRFVDREEACKIAKEAKQIIDIEHFEGTELFSEDLY